MGRTWDDWEADCSRQKSSTQRCFKRGPIQETGAQCGAGINCRTGWRNDVTHFKDTTRSSVYAKKWLVSGPASSNVGHRKPRFSFAGGRFTTEGVGAIQIEWQDRGSDAGPVKAGTNWPSVDLIVGQCLRHWPTIKSTLGWRLHWFQFQPLQDINLSSLFTGPGKQDNPAEVLQLSLWQISISDPGFFKLPWSLHPVTISGTFQGELHPSQSQDWAYRPY